MKEYSRIHGFSQLREVRLDELSAVMHEFVHDRTGLKLVWLERDEENKTFGIAFKTTPEDDTGVFHILEHSVLCGSEKYPVKEPFVELLKSSLNTFLNAMTFPDKTFYPVSSRNSVDFMNLMRVYLDAVFRPAILTKPEIFYQEGWHVHFDDQGGQAYQGVVFNEMKGAFADAGRLMNMHLERALFPDNAYRFVSGGDPDHIPDLTYEDFLAAWKKYYSPSNAYVFLDGSLDLDAVLTVLEEDYLSAIPAGSAIPGPDMQKPVRQEEITAPYAIGKDQPLEGKTRTAWGFVIGSFRDRELLAAAEALSDVICGSNQSPLSRAVLGAGLAEDVILSVQDSVLQPWIKLELRNITEGKKEEAEKLVMDTLKKLSEGLDHKQIEAVLANMEFQMRERDFGGYPQGLVYGMQALDSWLYGGLPEANLTVGDLFEHLHKALEENRFEELIRKMFLENNHCAKVTLVPSHTAGDEREGREKARLEREMAGWSEEEKAAVHTRQDVLTAWQKQEDTPEALASIPKLTLKDLESKPEDFPLEIVRAGETNILVHPLHTGGIVYVTLFFDADGLSREELSCLSLLCDLIGSLPTRTHTGNEVVTLQRLLLGQMSVAVQTFVKDGQNDTCLTKLCVGFNTLERNVQEAVAFITEMLTETQLTDEAQIMEIIKQGKTTLSQQMIMAGHSAARKSLRAQLLSAGAVEECLDGFAAYSWLRSLEDHFAFAPLSESLRELYSRLICRRGLTISVTGDMTEEVQRAMNMLRDALPEGSPKKAGSLLLPRGMCREGIVIPAEIAFAVRGGYMPGFNGLMPLLSKVVSLGYLWNVIRVQGGAYGTGLSISPDGIAACYSYRDPNGAGSLEKYMGCADFVRNMCRENPDLTGFIIGTVSDASPLLTPRMKGQMADSLYWRELPYEVRCARRQEMLAATPAQLADLADRLDDAMKNSGICVVGSQRQLDACGKLDSVMTL